MYTNNDSNGNNNDNIVAPCGAATALNAQDAPPRMPSGEPAVRRKEKETIQRQSKLIYIRNEITKKTMKIYKNITNIKVITKDKPIQINKYSMN